MLPQVTSDVTARLVLDSADDENDESPESREKDVCEGEIAKIGVGSSSCLDGDDEDDEAAAIIEGKIDGRKSRRGLGEPKPKR